MSMKRVASVVSPAVLAGLVLAALLVAPAAAAPVATASACTPAKDIEAIVDDSGSMAASDPNTLRVQGLNLLIGTLSPSTTLGAVEFGSGITGLTPAAETLFPPEPIGPNAAAMRSVMAEKIKADNGATDYNGAFAKADADNPGADARIFLTDGGHNEGDYGEAHLVHRVPTYVIGFGSGLTEPEDQGRLEKIATDTGGKYFSLQDSSQLQAVMNSIGAALTCQTPPRQFTDVLGQGQTKLHGVTVGANTKSLQIALTWASPLDAFQLLGLKLVSGKEVLAVAARPGKHRKPGKLKVTRTASSTFVVLKVSHLHPGRLVFKVKATKVGSGEPKATLTTQVGQATHK
ncbi:MAG TPA: vWA domain-containing protein [Solirubrobacterales bacterium]|nr:vWA domain-containing protein [Solirubrobacterales bacterium]